MHIRGVCITCNKNPQKSKGKKNNKTIYASICSTCHQKKYRRLRGYRRFKKDVCSFCGFVPVHACQLDVDHIDGNHKNNKIENLQTLCANCHRLKTFASGYGKN